MTKEQAKLEWERVCYAMLRGTWQGSEADAMARIREMKAIINEDESNGLCRIGSCQGL
jgi:hypothetical protein